MCTVANQSQQRFIFFLTFNNSSSGTADDFCSLFLSSASTNVAGTLRVSVFCFLLRTTTPGQQSEAGWSRLYVQIAHVRTSQLYRISPVEREAGGVYGSLPASLSHTAERAPQDTKAVEHVDMQYTTYYQYRTYPKRSPPALPMFFYLTVTSFFFHYVLVIIHAADDEELITQYINYTCKDNL